LKQLSQKTPKSKKLSTPMATVRRRVIRLKSDNFLKGEYMRVKANSRESVLDRLPVATRVDEVVLAKEPMKIIAIIWVAITTKENMFIIIDDVR
jgi:DNA-binding Lrp family transcriptional regulator